MNRHHQRGVGYWRSTLLPEQFESAHALCFYQHDLLVELLRAAEAYKVFERQYSFASDKERSDLVESTDLFDWFERTGRTSDRDGLIRISAFQAILSDFLHFVFAALDASSQGKLSVAYALIRKPIQENLYLLELVATDNAKFAQKLITNPLTLRSRKAGMTALTDQVVRTIEQLGEQDRFDPSFLAQLRYDTTAEDGFDGVCNKAIHLFTAHEAIQTEPFNINFVFSGYDSKISQWSYLYSRLPYILFYARSVVEHVCAQFSTTDPVYAADIERRAMAGMLLWSFVIEPRYRYAALEQFVRATSARLTRESTKAGFGAVENRHLKRMHSTGAYPGESRVLTKLRNLSYSTTRVSHRIAQVIYKTVDRVSRE